MMIYNDTRKELESSKEKRKEKRKEKKRKEIQYIQKTKKREPALAISIK